MGEIFLSCKDLASNSHELEVQYVLVRYGGEVQCLDIVSLEQGNMHFLKILKGQGIAVAALVD
jgi:hypothetical protein